VLPICRFQSTRPRGARPLDHVRYVNRPRVSIHAPARGATRHAGLLAHRIKSFNPRAREGRDLAHLAVIRIFVKVSIHAPARGATGFDRGSRQLCKVSIHAPARGATSFRPRSMPTPFSFNPRAREGRDAINAAKHRRIAGFNPRAREGRDSGDSCTIFAARLFQSTRPRGARLQREVSPSIC